MDVVRETIFPPQQNPTTPQVLMLLYLASICLRKEGTFAAVVGGAPVVLKKFPSFSPFSLVSGGYLEIQLSVNMIAGIEERRLWVVM